MKRTAQFSSRAIVLSKECFGEADLYIQFYTQHWGMITLLARSARKSKRRYIGGLDLFCHDEIFIKGDPRGKAYLVELTVRNSFPMLRENLDKVMCAGKIVQWVRKLADTAIPMPSIYSLLGQTLSLIEREDCRERLELLNLVFKLKLLDLLGLKPRTESCTQCGDTESEDVVFDLQAGGVLCRNCVSQTTLSERRFLEREERSFLLVADRFRLVAWDQIEFSPDKAGNLMRLVTQFASFHTHLKLPC